MTRFGDKPPSEAVVVRMPPKGRTEVPVRVRYVRKAKPLVVEPITEEDADSNEDH